MQTVSFQRLAAAFHNFYWTFPPLCPLKSSQFVFDVFDMFQFRFSHLRTVYESLSPCESWELSDLRRSSLLMALRELGYWQGAKWHKILQKFYIILSIILSYPQNSWHIAAWYPSGREELRDLRDLTGSPTGKPDDEAALDEVGSLACPHRSKWCIKCINWMYGHILDSLD